LGWTLRSTHKTPPPPRQTQKRNEALEPPKDKKNLGLKGTALPESYSTWEVSEAWNHMLGAGKFRMAEGRLREATGHPK
jgi:hypothetical protein